MTRPSLDTLRGAGRVAIWGFGIEGKAVFEYIGEHFPDVQLSVLSDRPLPEPDIAWIGRTAGKPWSSSMATLSPPPCGPATST